tara:strand:- start:517 stop:663 length:147 start_codon:yes stop_codon:yes gene_type:complete
MAFRIYEEASPYSSTADDCHISSFTVKDMRNNQFAKQIEVMIAIYVFL